MSAPAPEIERLKQVWHWVCTDCADRRKVAHAYRLDGRRRPAALCCFCRVNPPAGVLEAKAQRRDTCPCSETSL